MSQECELGEDHPQRAGQQQLQPGVIEQDHPSASAGQSKQQNHEDHQIEAAAATLQSARTDSLGQLGKCIGERLLA